VDQGTVFLLMTLSGAFDYRVTGFAPELAPWSDRFDGHDRTKFVKNQYEFASDFNFVRHRCRKATLTVNRMMNSGHTWLGLGSGRGLPRHLRPATSSQNPLDPRWSQACAVSTDSVACAQI
jgi:hypothetical protein